MLVSRFFSILIFINFCSLNAFILNPESYQEHAQQWENSFLSSSDNVNTISDSDLELIANLFYFSFLRSVATLEAQDVAYQTLETVWQGWQNIAQTRMNPSLAAPYEVDFSKQELLFKRFIDVQFSHRIVGIAYAQCAQAIVKDNFLHDAHSLKSVGNVREEARTIIIQAVLDVKKILGELYHYASHHLRAIEITPEEDDIMRFDFFDTVSQYIPFFAMKSFIEAERINTQASEQSWEIVRTITSVSKQIWDAIEIARASYYLAHYRTCMKIIHTRSNYQPLLMFNEYGYITSNHTLLPIL